MDKWIENARARIKELKHSHHLQRIQWELAFETAPRDSRYSNGLIDMMRKEEQIIARDPNSAVTQSVIQKVDESLRAETRAFFAKATQKNVKRWAALKEKLDRETQQFVREVSEEMKAFSHVKGSKEPRRNAVPTPEELDREAERLECDYNQNWYKYESFSLQEAFKSQNNRIENDWGTHERALEEEYQQKREKVAGPGHARMPTSPQPTNAHDPRWQHPEKQKTLIHTAPVLSPTRTQQSAADSLGWAKGKDNAAISAEVSIDWYWCLLSERLCNDAHHLFCSPLSLLYFCGNCALCIITAGEAASRARGRRRRDAEAEGRRQTLAPAATSALAGAGRGGAVGARRHRRDPQRGLPPAAALDPDAGSGGASVITSIYGNDGETTE